MATRIMTIRSCDECNADDSDEGVIESFTVTRLMNNGRTVVYEMDLCEECGAGLEAAYSEIWRRPSKASGKATPKAAVPLPDDGWEWDCPQCDFRAANKQGLGNHVARKHS